MKQKKWIQKGITIAVTMAMAVSLIGCGSGGKGSAKQKQKDMKELVYEADELPFMDQLQGEMASYAIKGDEIYIYNTEWIEQEGGDKPQTLEEPVVTKEQETEETEEDATDENIASDDVNAAIEDLGEEEQSLEEEEDEIAEDEEGSEKKENSDGADADLIDSGNETADEKEYTYTINKFFYRAKLDGSKVETLIEELDCGEQTEWLNSFSIAGNGDLYMFYSTYNETTEQSEFTIHILDENGKEKSMFSLTDIISSEDGYVQSMCLDADSNMYFLTDQKVFVVQPDGSEMFQVKMEGWASNMTRMNDGTIVVSTYEDGGMVIKAVDTKAKDWGKTYKLESNLYGNNTFVGGYGEYSFFLSDNSNLYGYNVESEKMTPILNWVSSNIGGSNVGNITAMEDGSFICYYSDNTLGEEAKNSLYMLKKIDPSQVADKVIITYAGMYVDDQVKTQAVRFNKSQNEYQIVVKDYSNSEDAVKDMNADLLAGDIPDIIDLSNLNVEKYIAKGMLADLYPFIEKDADIHKEDFQENILKLMEKEGKLYCISPSFGINALIARTSDIGDAGSFTIDDLVQLEEKYGKDASAFHMCSNTNALTKVCSGNYSNYINWETGKCSFDGEDFIKLLEYANKYPKDEELNWDDYVSLPTMIRQKKCLFAEVYGVSMEEIELYSEMFGEDVTFVGYPSDSATGPAVNLNTNIGIYAKTANPDAAWAFVKTFLTEEYIEGKGNYFYGGFPLRKDALEDEIKKYSTKTAYTDQFGNEINPLDSTWGYDDIEVKIDPLTDEQVKKVRQVIETADHLYNYDEEIMNIITEEAAAFFEGQKSAKEVADIIQNRVSTYVNENR